MSIKKKKKTLSSALVSTFQLKVVSVLLGAGADVNAVDVDGLSPLHEACNNGDLTMVSLLLQSGANCGLGMSCTHLPSCL